MKKILVFITIIGFYSSLYSQEKTIKVKPDDHLIDGSFIEAYTNRWKVSFIDAQGTKTPNKIWTDYGQILELDGKNYFHRVQDLYDPNMILQDTWINMVEHKTLIPVSYTSIKPSGVFTYLEFDGMIIIGNSNQNTENKTEKINTNLDEAFFDWNMYGMLLVGLPFEEGFKAKLPIYTKQSADLQWLEISIVGQEEVEQLNGEKIRVWKVETDKRLTFWLTKSAPYVIQLELELQNNSKLLWEVF